MLIVQCLPMLVSTIDMNMLVITTNSSMSRLDCSPDSMSLNHRRQFPQSAFPRYYFPRTTSRVRDLRYNRATTRSRSNSAPRLSVPLWNATVCAVNERASSYSQISTRFENGQFSPAITMSLDAVQVFCDLIAFYYKSDYRTLTIIQ